MLEKFIDNDVMGVLRNIEKILLLMKHKQWRNETSLGYYHAQHMFFAN